MMNLIGCSKQNFYELMGLMKYKKHNEKEDMFKYIGQRKKVDKRKTLAKKYSPFTKLMSLNLK